MKLDSDVWRLHDLLLSFHLPVGHPDFLATLGQRIRAANAAEGYRFSISDCSGRAAHHFQVVAMPQSTEDGQRAFCADESGKIRYAEDGEVAGCLSSGEPLP